MKMRPLTFVLAFNAMFVGSPTFAKGTLRAYDGLLLRTR
jgi:hypothetical protein